MIHWGSPRLGRRYTSAEVGRVERCRAGGEAQVGEGGPHAGAVEHVGQQDRAHRHARLHQRHVRRQQAGADAGQHRHLDRFGAVARARPAPPRPAAEAPAASSADRRPPRDADRPRARAGSPSAPDVVVGQQVAGRLHHPGGAAVVDLERVVGGAREERGVLDQEPRDRRPRARRSSGRRRPTPNTSRPGAASSRTSRTWAGVRSWSSSTSRWRCAACIRPPEAARRRAAPRPPPYTCSSKSTTPLRLQLGPVRRRTRRRSRARRPARPRPRSGSRRPSRIGGERLQVGPQRIGVGRAGGATAPGGRGCAGPPARRSPAARRPRGRPGSP